MSLYLFKDEHDTYRERMQTHWTDMSKQTSKPHSEKVWVCWRIARVEPSHLRTKPSARKDARKVLGALLVIKQYKLSARNMLRTTLQSPQNFDTIRKSKTPYAKRSSYRRPQSRASMIDCAFNPNIYIYIYIYIYIQRKFRSLTSDNMDSWKSSAARKKINRCGKKEDQQARNVREVAKCCVFQCFVCRLGRKVTSLKRRVRRWLLREDMKNGTPL